MVDHKPTVAAAVILPKQRCGSGGFTLAELLITVGVLVVVVLLFTQLLKSAATITTLGHKRMDADSQARQVLDRMAIDFAQMVKRSDVDYYVKSNPLVARQRTVLQPGNDRIAFYSSVPGYYPSTGSQSPVSLVAYRINSRNKLERMGKGLVWNAVSTSDTPVVFIPISLASPVPPSPTPTTTPFPTPTPSPVPSPIPTATSTPAWPAAGDPALPSWADGELIGPQIFRFEYYYLLNNGTLSDIPWDTNPSLLPPHVDVSGMQDVAAIIVDIAMIDPRSKVLVTDAQIATFSTPGNAHFLADYSSGMTPGQLRTQWQNKLNGIIDPNSPDYDPTMPRAAIPGIRLYERSFYLSPPTLNTP
jgi:hypothetical protein